MWAAPTQHLVSADSHGHTGRQMEDSPRRLRQQGAREGFLEEEAAERRLQGKEVPAEQWEERKACGQRRDQSWLRAPTPFWNQRTLGR